jgi:hypothetical protein
MAFVGGRPQVAAFAAGPRSLYLSMYSQGSRRMVWRSEFDNAAP